MPADTRIPITVDIHLLPLRHGFHYRQPPARAHHRSLHISHHRNVSPDCRQSRILLGHTLLVDIPAVRAGKHCHLTVGRKHHPVGLGRRICLLVILVYQGALRPKEAGSKRVVPQKPQTHLQILEPGNPHLTAYPATINKKRLSLQKILPPL